MLALGLFWLFVLMVFLCSEPQSQLTKCDIYLAGGMFMMAAFGLCVGVTSMAKKMGEWEIKRKRAIDKKAREGNKRKRQKRGRGQVGKKRKATKPQPKVVAAATTVSQPVVPMGQVTTQKPSVEKRKVQKTRWRVWQQKVFGRGR